MAGYYDPYENYWQGTPQRGNVKQPTGLAVLLNAILGGGMQGYQQGMGMKTVAQEQQLREQQRQTNLLQQQKMKDEMEWEPIKRQMEVSKEYGGEVNLTPEQRAVFQRKGIGIPEGPLQPMGEQKLLAQIQMHDSKIAQLDRFLEHKQAVAQQLDEHLKRLDEVRGRGADVAEERNRLIGQTNNIKLELGQAETARKTLKDKADQLKMSAKDMFSTDKLSAMYWQDMIKSGKATPQHFLDWQMKVRTGPATVAAGASGQRDLAAMSRTVVDNMEEQIKATKAAFSRDHGWRKPDSPAYVQAKAAMDNEVRSIYKRFTSMYPFLKLEMPIDVTEENPFLRDKPIPK